MGRSLLTFLLAGLVVHQLTRPGAPFIYGVGCGAFDMRTAQDVYGAPEHFLGNAAATDLARFYGLPSFSYAAVSDAKSFDEQWAAGKCFITQFTTFQCCLSSLRPLILAL